MALELLLGHPGLEVSGDGGDHGASNPSAVLPQPWLGMEHLSELTMETTEDDESEPYVTRIWTTLATCDAM